MKHNDKCNDNDTYNRKSYSNKIIAKQTSWPSRQPNSSDTRLATDIAATRRGWVQPILPFTV